VSTNEPLYEPTGSRGFPHDPNDEGSRAEHIADAARDEGRALAGSAAEEARTVGQTVQQQAARVTDEVATQARDLVSSATSTLERQAEDEAHKLAGVLRSAGDQARALAEGRTEDAGDIDKYVRAIAGTLSDIAVRVDELGARGSVEELREFARRRPGLFLAGAATVGFLGSRFVRNAGGDGAASDGRSRQASRSIPSATAPAQLSGSARPVASSEARSGVSGALPSQQGSGRSAMGTVGDVGPEVR
jgi:hypothetical protein